MKQFYLDTCIWLNLFKKEKNYWQIAKDFIENVMFSNDKEITYSGFVLKELRFKLDNEVYSQKLKFLKDEFKFIKTTEEDYEFARKLESELKYEISFFDCLHIAICKRLSLILVTRDYRLIKIAKNYIPTKRPEELYFI